MDIENIISQLKKQLPVLSKEYAVKSLGVFGSYVRGEQQHDSDLDLLVSFDKKPSLLNFIKLENQISDKLGIKVDLVMQSSLKPNIGKRIMEEVVTL